MQSGSDKILVGRITAAHGVRGWVKVRSFTRPVENILNYTPWLLATRAGLMSREVLESRQQGNGFIVRLAEVDDRDQAQSLGATDILVPRDSLPVLKPGEHYWHDILGMTVVNAGGEELGIVKQVLETGANDVIVVEGAQRWLIPWVRDVYITGVHPDSNRIEVDWRGVE